MDPDAIALFRELADRSASEREEYYASHHVTGALRTEIESLLRFDRNTVDSLHDPVAFAAESALLETDPDVLGVTGEARAAWLARAQAVIDSGGRSWANTPATADGPGSWFGPYRLREPLGEGGMGVVWLADQDRPIRRTVAIKVVRRGADSDRVLSRFDSERQALAILNHPHIAKVLDAGSTPDGRPYFVMENVAGHSITNFADQHRLTIAQRLELFLQVCDAVQHAHQKGLLHRDLKPGNILVADVEGRAVAKVIDFGIAKAIGQRLTGETLVTEFGVFVGTPEYMSPEQAGLLNASVDTRTDIFSLGLVLYELLVGAPPFDALKQGRNTVLELLRVIREEEPPRLTRRLTSQDETALREIARRRQTEPRALASLLRGDLEWITARAIEKEPARRYSSVSELAADVRRYLDSEPVTAGPPDLLYRLGKLTRKHRATAIAAAAAICIVIVASVVSTAFWIRSEQARRETRRQLVSLHVAEGMRLVDENDHLRALPWLAGALSIEPHGEVAEEAHRRRIAMVLDRTPTLANVWAFDVDVVDAVVSPDRTWVALATTDGAPRIVDIEKNIVSIGRERHAGRINAVAISRNGQWIATAGADRSARVWNKALEATGPPLQHESEVLGVAISPDGTRVATTVHNEVVHVWDAARGTLRFTLAHDAPVVALEFSPDGQLIATAVGNTIRFWDAQTGQPTGSELRHSHQVDRLKFSPDGTRLAISANATLRVWNVADRQPLGNEILQTNPIYEIAFSPDGRWLAWGSSGNLLGIIDAQTGTLATPMLRRRDQVVSVAFSPDGRFLASLELGGYVQIWRTTDWQPEQLVLNGGAKPRSVFFDRTGRRLVLCGEEAMLMWDLAGAYSAYPPMTPGVRTLSVNPDGTSLLTTTGGFPGALDNFVRVWASATSEPITPPLREGGSIRGTFDSRGERIATGGQDGRARVWDARTGEPVGSPVIQGSFIVGLSFSPDGRYLATAGGDGLFEKRPGRGDICVWDLATGQARWRRQVSAVVSVIAFSTDGARLMTGTKTGEVTFWDATTGGRLPVEVTHGSMLHEITVSPDNRWSVTLSERAVHVWDHARGEGKWLGSHPSSISFDSQSTRLAIGTIDGEVSVWDPATGRSLGWQMKPGGMIYSARFDRDARYVVTASLDGTTRVWDAEGRALSPRLRHPGPVWSAHFAPDNRTIASGGGGAARIWDFRTADGGGEELTRLAEVMAGYRLDPSMAPAPLAPQDRRRNFDELRKSQPAWFSVTPPKEAQWQRSAAEWAFRVGRLGDAVTHFDRLVELEPTRAMTWAERGRTRAELGRWNEAIKDFERATELHSDAAEYFRDLALARLGGGDHAGFRRACTEMRARFGSTNNPDRAHWIARTCVLVAPGAGDDVSELVRAAERWREVEPNGVHQLGTLGAALMRGRSSDAAPTLRRALQAGGTKSDAWASLFLMILESKDRSISCQRASTTPWLVDDDSGARRTRATWRERVEVDALVRELCTAIHR